MVLNAEIASQTNAQQMNVALHAAGEHLHHGHRSNNLLAAPAAECLPGLHR